ncbi:MAG TPA: GTPase [Pyrodictium sp.]|nr:GTPase [Pyrodictium sp.]
MVFKDNPDYRVVAFTSTQIPGQEYRRYPASLAGRYYPQGIPIYPQEKLKTIIRAHAVDEVVLAYSDLTFDELGRIICEALASGVSFKIVGPRETMLDSIKPVIAITAVKTGAGKSTTSRTIVRELLARGFMPAVVRHPMAYGNLEKRKVVIIRNSRDLEEYDLTLEEREEFEPYIEIGVTVLAGVDYRLVLLEAERIGDIIVWDGGNNDWPFIRPDYWVTVVDALRPHLVDNTYPGLVNLKLADAVIVTKTNIASREQIESVVNKVRKVNPHASISLATLNVEVEEPDAIKGKKVVVIEDAPTVTHGGAPYGAGYIAAKLYGASEIIDPRPHARGTLKQVYEQYTHIGPVIPSLGYTEEQLHDLSETIKSIPADLVIVATPAKLEDLIEFNKPIVRVRYELEIESGPTISDIVDEFLERVKNGSQSGP